MSGAPVRLNLPYLPPTGGPHYWTHEETGRLREAVLAFYAEGGPAKGPAMSTEQLQLFKAYLVYWIEAPAWYLPELARFVAAIDNAENAAALWVVLHELLDYEIDPL